MRTSEVRRRVRAAGDGAPGEVRVGEDPKPGGQKDGGPGKGCGLTLRPSISF